MANTYTLISSVTVGAGGASSIDFTSIPATYTDLVLRVSARNTTAATSENLQLTFNGSTSGYSDRLLYGTGSAAASASQNTNGRINYFYTTGASATSNTFGNQDIYIPNYAGSSNKSVSIDGVTENNATAALAFLDAGLWSNTSAITSLSIKLDSGTFVQYTTAYLYGISNS